MRTIAGTAHQQSEYKFWYALLDSFDSLIVCCRFAKALCTFDVVLVATDKHNLRQRLRRGTEGG